MRFSSNWFLVLGWFAAALALAFMGYVVIFF